MSVNRENWRWVDGYEGLYLVSDKGNVMVMPRNNKPAFLVKQHDCNGYKTVTLFKDGYKSHFVHRLVAQAFIPNENCAEQVNHKDGARTNNDVGNLEWVTASENNAHKYQVLKRTHAVKSRRKLTDDQVREIRSSGLPYRAIAKAYGVTYQAIRQIKNRKSYKDVM